HLRSERNVLQHRDRRHPAVESDAIAVIGFDESKKILTHEQGEDRTRQKLVYGTDGNMVNALSAGLPPGLLTGAIGTYGILKFDAQNNIDQAAIQYRTVGATH
ncbi:MAG TPA: hypothetical protein VFN75_09455, partial [Pseudonocardiaceae bacterium]|nr:hypothetical protein [Pseudonocardiaceae bacterium]